MGSPRRQTDSEEEDYTSHRGGRLLNGHTRWVIGAVSAGILSLSAFLLVNDRNGIEKRLENAERRDDTFQVTLQQALQVQAATNAETQARWGEIQRTLLELKADLKEIKRGR